MISKEVIKEVIKDLRDIETKEEEIECEEYDEVNVYSIKYKGKYVEEDDVLNDVMKRLENVEECKELLKDMKKIEIEEEMVTDTKNNCWRKVFAITYKDAPIFDPKDMFNDIAKGLEKMIK